LELRILGSAAAEGWPALFCSCAACAKARELGGKDLRRRTSYRLGEHIQIDWGPDTFGAYTAYGLDMTTLKDLVVTHNHADHFTAQEFFYRRSGYSQVPEESVLRIHGPAGVGEALGGPCEDSALFRLTFDELGVYEERPLSDDVTVTSIPASHAPDIGGAYNYIFNVSGRYFLLGHDTGWWEDEVWEYLGDYQFNLVVMDCTYGHRAHRGGHLGCPDVVDAKQELVSRGALAHDCRFVANHFSHNGEWLQAQMEEFFAPHDILVGYDGMIIDV